MNKLTEYISTHSIEYGSIPFWSWNDRLSPDELRRQIRNMHELRMRGFFMHARGGLMTEYMSDEWFECIDACIDEAKKLGMEAWAYDENGWPSGFAGGKVLEEPENHAVYVYARLLESFPDRTEELLAVYVRDGKGVPTRVSEAAENCQEYLAVYLGTDSSYIDAMREDVVDKFIEYTHEVYKQRIGDEFGKTMPGFFTDEPQYYRWKTPYSKKMEEWFLEEYDYSVLDALPALFVDYEGAEEYRYDYHRLTNKKFTESFSKRLYDWAEANGIMITGHHIEESSLDGQMMCCGDVMPQYLYQHIPGIDYLGRKVKGYVMGKQLGSVCAQTGRKKALTESFACCGWDVTPRELKNIAEIQFSGGANLICQHLYPYSIRGQRKRDYPAFYSEHNPWQEDMKEFDQYFNNLGCMLSMGEELADTLVIHPIRSRWLTYQRDPIEKVNSTVNEDFEYLLQLLGSHGGFHLGCETMMDTMASVEGNRIKVGPCEYKQVIVPSCDTLNSNTVKLLKEFMAAGGKVYTFRNLPTRIDGRRADLSFLSECEDLSDIYIWCQFNEELPIRKIVCNSEGHSELGNTLMMVRKTEYGRLIYITNLTEFEFNLLSLDVADCTRLGRIDISTLDITPVQGQKTDRGVRIYFGLNAGESAVFCEYDAPEFLPPDIKIRKKTFPSLFDPDRTVCLDEKYIEKPRCITTDTPFKAEPIKNNMLTLDRARISLDGGEFSELRPLERIRDELLSSRYKGRITLRFPFEIKDIPDSLSVVTEPFGGDTITVNGREVKISDERIIDRDFALTDISAYCKTGENTVDMTLDYYQRDYVYYVLYGGVSETLRNCLVFDTDIECIYLMGNFALDMKRDDFTPKENNAFTYEPEKGMALIKPKDSPDGENIVLDGYPFYAGELVLKARYTYKKGDPTVLKLTGRFATAHVSVNGREAGKLIFSSYIDLAEYLAEGDNEITVILRNSYRNLMGPHHRSPAEPLSVSPRAFSFEKMWKNGECELYRSRYAFVRYGIDK